MYLKYDLFGSGGMVFQYFSEAYSFYVKKTPKNPNEAKY